MAPLTNDQKYGLFKLLEKRSLYEAGLEFGLDKNYKTAASMNAAVYKIYSAIKNDPTRFGADMDVVNKVVSAVSTRGKYRDNIALTLREKQEIAQNDVKELLLDTRNVSLQMLRNKLYSIGKEKKAMENLSLSEIAKVFGILFDKGQLISGQATEHIAHLSKISENLSPQEMLDAVINQRENIVAKNNI